MSAPITQADREAIERIAAGLPNDVRRALTVKGAAIPDSLWHGEYRHLIRCEGFGWRWSDKGLAVREVLKGDG